MHRTQTLQRLTLATAVALALAASTAHAATYVFDSGTFVAGVTAPNPLGAGDVLNIGAGGFKFFSGAGSDFSNSGTVNWNADALFLQSGAALVNNGLWTASSDDILYYNGGSAPSFTNNGSFRKIGGSGSTTINNLVGFVNNGTLDAQTGSLAFVGGSVFNSGSVFTGAGLVTMASGTNTFNGSFTASNLLLSGGTHQGDAAVVGGMVAFSGGTLSGSWQVAAGQTLQATGGSFKSIRGGSTVLNNLGTVAWNTSEALFMHSGGIVNNQGLFLANADTTVFYSGGAAPGFNNLAAGTVRAATGKMLTLGNTIGFVNHGGMLDAQAGGTLQYVGGSVFNAGSQFTGAGRNLAVGDNAFNGSLQSQNLVLASGTHQGAAAVVNGSVEFSGGTLGGTWRVAAGQTLQASSGGFKFIAGDSTVMTNQGTLAWNTSDALFMQSGGRVVNQGLFLANADTTIFYNGGSAPAFDNSTSGTVRAAAGKALTIGNTVGFVNNGGVLDAQVGATLQYVGGSVFNAGSQFTGAGSNLANGNNRFSGAFTSTNLVLGSGVHSGDAAVIQGGVTFAGGDLVGSWQVAPGQALTAASGPFKFISGAGTVVSNRGTLNWNTPDHLYLQTGAILRNDGDFNIGTDVAVFYNGGAAPSFVNQGLIAKTGGAGTTSIGDNLGFSNLGTVDVRTGTFALPGNFGNQGRLTGGGSFAVSGTLGNAGTLAPGAPVGSLGLSGNYAQAAGGTLEVDLQSVVLHDLFNISGTASLDGTLSLRCAVGCSLAVGQVLTILDSAGDLSGSFASVALTGFASGAFDVVYDTLNDRVQLRVTQAVSGVPEPGTWAMLLAGCAGLLARVRRRPA